MSLTLPLEGISGSENVIAALGYWPKFHDAEVILFSAARASPFKTGDTVGHLNLNVREYIPVGDSTPKKSNFRLICATNRDLKSESEANRFRSDLYFRLKFVY